MRVSLFVIILCIYSNLLYSQNETKQDWIKFDSLPQGAEIFIDDTFWGITPIIYKIPGEKQINIKVKLKGEIIRERIYDYKEGEEEVFFVLDGEYGLLNISTLPGNAQVFINDTLVGVTPLKNRRINLGKSRIKVTKKDFTRLETEIDVIQTKYEYNFNLHYKYGLVSNNTIRDDIRLIHEHEIISFPFSNIKIDAGLQYISVIDSSNNEITREEFYLERAKRYNLIVDHNFFTLKKFILSSLIPGGGQIIDGEIIKGGSFFLLSVTNAVLFFIENSNYSNKMNEYNRIQESYINEINERDALNLSIELENKTNELNDSATRKDLLLGSLIGIYALNLIDALIFHTRDTDIELIPVTDLETKSVGLNFSLNF